MSALRLALRIARRDARRTKGRSALVVVLLALPVVAIAYGATMFDSMELTTAERLDRDLGAADAAVRWAYDGPVFQEPDNRWLGAYPGTPDAQDADLAEHVAAEDPAAEILGLLPPGSRAVAAYDLSGNVTVPAGVDHMGLTLVDLTDPMTAGIYPLLRGEVPDAAGEIAISEAAAELTGQPIGGTVQFTDPEISFTVVGVVENPNALNYPFGIAAPGGVADAAVDRVYVDTPTPLTWADVQALNAEGIAVYSRTVSLDPPKVDLPWSGSGDGPDAEDLSMVGLVVAMVVLELILLAGPAFAIGTKRRSREFALLAANGATPGQVRRTVLAGGVVLGAFGAVAGVVVGCLAAVATMPIAEQVVGQRSGALRFWPEFTASLALLAVVTGLLAALVPAFTVARQDIVTALTGRRGAVRSKKRWLVIGLVMVGIAVMVGVGGAFTGEQPLLITAAALGQLGLVLCTPAIVGGVSRLARLLPLSPRIALRDAGRNRAATAPAISAVMAVVTGAIAIGAFAVAQNDRWENVNELALPEGTVTGYVYQNQEWDEATQELKPLPEDAPRRLESALADAEDMMRRHLPVDTVYRVSDAVCVQPEQQGMGCDLRVQPPPDKACPYDEKARTGMLTEEEQASAVADPNCRMTTYGMGSMALGGGRIVDDGTLLTALSRATPEEIEEAVEVLRAGGVVVCDPHLIDAEGRVTVAVVDISWATEEPQSTVRDSVTVPGYALTTSTLPREVTFYSPAAAERLKLETPVHGLIATVTRAPTEQEEQGFTAAYEASGMRDRTAEGEVMVDLTVTHQDAEISGEQYAVWILAGIAGVIALGATAVATGLAAAEGRKDLSTLATVGASPGVRRRLALCQSGTISLLGALLGTLAGLGASFVVLMALNTNVAGFYPLQPKYPMTVPWPVLAMALLVIPVIAMLGAGLLTRSRLPVERRTG